MIYQIRCSYCGCYMGEKEAPANAFAIKMELLGLPIETHSICGQCRRFILEDIRSISIKGDDHEQR
ncbi:MAG: hypothetical protein HQK63_15505 [Desulfamplus sp.]|nr:hypothetical protein [Desulfamplus sp.]